MISVDGTIVAIATPLGEGGLGVVRLSGTDAFRIADALFKSKQKVSDAAGHSLITGWIPPIDQVVAAVFRAPHSYTGEDVVEFSCHGSPVVLKEVVQRCEKEGARLAKPGEFTERAYVNGKIDLLQAEAVADLIHAQSVRARQAATDQLRGELSMRINGLREQLITLLAHMEANLDFAEEEIPIIAPEKIIKSLDSIQKGLAELLATSVRGRVLREGLRVTLAGQPNVGKSSIFNSFLAQNRAIVTEHPGTTRDTLEEKLEWDGFPVVLTDTAGLRSTIDPIEAEGTARANQAHAQADVIVLVMDGSAAISPEDERIEAGLHEKKVVVALNKSDRSRMAVWKGQTAAIWVSAKTGEGLPELKRAILATVGSSNEQESATVVTNLRHAGHLDAAARHLEAARVAAQRTEPEETVALDLRAALEELGHITGESVTEDVLSAIFRTFCIGK